MKTQTLDEWAKDWSYFPKKFPFLTSRLAKPFEERGWKKGRKEGKEEGRKEGAEAVQRELLKMLDAKLGNVSASDVAVVRAIQDVKALAAMFAELGAMEDAKKIRAAIARRRRVARTAPKRPRR